MTNRRQRAEALPIIAVSVTEAARQIGVSRATAYRMVADGQLRSVKARTRVVIPVAAVAEFLSAAS